MKIIEANISKRELNEMAQAIKAVVDVEREGSAVDAELHSDLEAYS